MCGIAGVYNRASGAEAPRHVLEQMLVCLQHRGPDQEGLFQAGSIGLAHRRLTVIDLATGEQPMSDPTGRVTLIYNGEVWNYRGLRDTLRKRGHRFRTQSDTEVVLAAYLEYGGDFVQHLDGMFALALWDARRRQLVLARDRLGKKPLYYTVVDGGDVIFGSEIKALLCDGRVRAGLDPQALADFLVLRYVPAPATMFAGIRKLPPATVMMVSESGMTQRPYWELPVRGGLPVPQALPALTEQVRATVREAVRARLVSDVPLGALLSGGVDSSILVAEASDLSTRLLKTFSVRFVDAPPEYDETPHARFVAERFGTEHHELDVGEQDLLAALPTMAWHRDEPVSEPAEIPTYLICRAAKPRATVLLSGEGGDELFAGYPKYAYDWLASYLRWLPAWLHRGAQGAVAITPARYRRLKIGARGILEPDDVTRWLAWFGAFGDAEKLSLLTPEFRERVAAPRSSRIFGERLTDLRGLSPLEQMLALDLAIWLPDNLLMKGDKASMAASTELRMPFLDRELLTLATGIPAKQRVRPFVSKYLLKESYVGVLPREFLYRRKVGFRVPVAEWFRSEHFSFLPALLLGERAQARNIFEPDAVARLLAEHRSGRVNHHSRLFVLLAVELWHRAYIDRAFASRPTWEDLLDPSEIDGIGSGQRLAVA